MAQVGYYAETPQFCKDCGSQGAESFFDNRVRGDENITAGKFLGPDFKCRNCEGGNGKNKPIYRPGSYNFNQALKGGGQPAQGQGAATAPPEEAPF